MGERRILAVIPVCEGLAALPHKNMRVIHGKPMAYYAIRNALDSEYVTDVIVTSNANEILSLGRQMGTMLRKRAQSLSNQNVSLDAVVYDVFNQLDISDYDIVVTMQSISPLLKVSTLDSAFRKMIDGDYDTMISVVNKAQFYWTERDGQATPLQQTRMNRHCLPSFYKETGAFLMTKSCFIRPDTRLGEKVGLFEMDDEEGLDINSFGDLYQADKLMEQKRTAIYVNGNDTIGLGHISRVQQVADDLFTRPDIYYDDNQTEPAAFGATPYRLFPVDGCDGFVRAVREKHYDIVINDVLSTSGEYMRALREALPRAHIVNFEDEGEGAAYANVVINALYETKGSGNVHYGSKYYILPKLFLIYTPIPIRDSVSNVLVTFGGADPCDYTDQVLEIIEGNEYRDVHFYIVLGRAKSNVKTLLQKDVGANVTCLYNIDNMPEIMSRCDIALTSRGRTCFELAALGIPTISIAQNEREERHDFASPENGFSYLGRQPGIRVIQRELDRYLHMDKVEREDLQRKMLRRNLRNGRSHVNELITRTEE